MRDFKQQHIANCPRGEGGGGGRADCKSREQERKNCGNKGEHKPIFLREQGNPQTSSFFGSTSYSKDKEQWSGFRIFTNEMNM